MKEAKKENIIVPAIEQIVTLIHKSTSDPQCVPAVLKAAIGLLGDLGSAYGARMFQIFSQPYILQLLQEGRQYEDLSSIVDYAQGVIHSVRSKK